MRDSCGRAHVANSCILVNTGLEVLEDGRIDHARLSCHGGDDFSEGPSVGDRNLEVVVRERLNVLLCRDKHQGENLYGDTTSRIGRI